MKVYYDDIVVGDFRADMIVDKRVIIELKAVNEMNKMFEVQLVNYLNVLHIDNGLLINFGTFDKGNMIKRKYRVLNR